MSSCAVYQKEHLLISEHEFDMQNYPLHWIDRPADYAEGKRQAERAVLEFMNITDCTFVRFPVVMGENDYTNRLRFYIQHICNRIPMFVDKLNTATSYINEYEAGEFLSFLMDNPVSGAVNGCSKGMISQHEIIKYIEEKTALNAIFSEDGDPAPYNGINSDISYHCAKAESLGFSFSEIHSWLFELLNHDLEAYYG